MVADAAFQLSCSERHIYELEASGLLDFCKLGPKATRVTSASVMRLMAQRARPSGHVPGLRQFANAKKRTGIAGVTRRTPPPTAAVFHFVGAVEAWRAAF